MNHCLTAASCCPSFFQGKLECSLIWGVLPLLSHLFLRLATWLGGVASQSAGVPIERYKFHIYTSICEICIRRVHVDNIIMYDVGELCLWIFCGVPTCNIHNFITIYPSERAGFGCGKCSVPRDSLRESSLSQGGCDMTFRI